MKKKARGVKRMRRTVGDEEWWAKRYRRAGELQDDNPEAVFRDAQEAFYYGLTGLLCFALSKNTVRAEEAKSVFTGSIGNLLERRIPSWVREGNVHAADLAWRACINLTEALHDIALKQPDVLKPLARDSVFCPSLRARPKNFTHDFEKIAQKIELASDLPVPLDAKTQSRLDNSITRLVLEIVLEVDHERQRVLRDIDHYKQRVSEDYESICRLASRSRAHRYAHLKSVKESLPTVYESFKELIGDGELREHFRAELKRIPEFRRMTRQEYLIKEDHHTTERLGYAELQPFAKGTFDAWWEHAVKLWLNEQGLERIRGTPLYDDIMRAATKRGSSKDYQLNAELKRRCRECLKRLAPPE